MSDIPRHGAAGQNQFLFVRCLPAQSDQHSKGDLARLALDMQAAEDSVDPGPDAEENMFVPAGYTYFGQFVDHDLSFDAVSTFDGSVSPLSQRTPRFDLDCLYGQGPTDRPDMYDPTGVFLVQGAVLDAESGRRDLLRDSADLAIIGDKRNDENSIVSQIHAAFIAFHNEMARKISATRGLNGKALFKAARQEVTWTYQKVLVEDYLKRIVSREVIENFDKLRRPNAKGKSQDENAFKLYVSVNRSGIPLEFAGAAYRFGHSMVRNGYFLQDGQSFPIFDGVMDEQSLVGFQKLPVNHVIRDWRRFFPDSSLESTAAGNTMNPAPGIPAGKGGKNVAPDDAPGAPRLQFAYRIDTSVSNPLASLPASVADDPPPSLIVRNLWRGAAFELPSGQEVAASLDIAPDSVKLMVREQIASSPSKTFQYREIDAIFKASTPLWFYVLAEAQQHVVAKFGSGKFSEDDLLENATETGTQLGPVGGRIVLEVFNGLLDSDPDSYRNHPDAENWTPIVKSFRVWDILTA
ncbi:peroxidase family protein [Paraburkholderia sp. RL17-337-BIB-A]|uniref:peroxidase family protein n=1 Tax=Paraburkholderia sp. RL17-337-BIB-A TaxID=3031636 RepID=UPI0038BC3D99